MPSLSPQPDDDLVRRILSLERRLAEVSTLRRNPAPGCKMAAASSQTFAGGIFTHAALTLDLPWTYSTAGMADEANGKIIVPADGIYLVLAFVPPMSGVLQAAASHITKNGSAQSDGFSFFDTNFSKGSSWSQVAAYAAGDAIGLGTLLADHDSTSWAVDTYHTLTVQRLSDVPDQS